VENIFAAPADPADASSISNHGSAAAVTAATTAPAAQMKKMKSENALLSRLRPGALTRSHTAVAELKVQNKRSRTVSADDSILAVSPSKKVCN